MLRARTTDQDTPPAWLFDTQVMHRRLKPFGHHFRYRIWQMLVDIDRLPQLDRISPLFGVDRIAPLQFLQQDHGPRDGSSLRAWAMRALSPLTVPEGGWGRIQLLCMPRVLGMGFNPLSIWYCEDGLGRIAAMIWEVSNTFGERHSYVIPHDPATGPILRQSCDKGFYVSPFQTMKQRYRFRTQLPDHRMQVVIRQNNQDGEQMIAAMIGTRKAMTAGSLARLAIGQPLLPAKVLTAIHWQAFRLWLKGAAFQPRPHAPAEISHPPHHPEPGTLPRQGTVQPTAAPRRGLQGQHNR